MQQQKETVAVVKDEKNDAVYAPNQFVEVNGRKLAYRSIGKGKPFILANRFRGIMDVWDPAFLNALAKNLNVIIFDYSGMGLSTGKAPETIEEFAKDIKDLADGLGIEKAIIGGWSFGAMVAEVTLSFHPGLASHIIVIGANPPGKNEGQIEPAFFDVSRRLNYTLEDETYLFFEPAVEASRIAAAKSRERLALRTEDLDIMIPQELWDNFSIGIGTFIEDKQDTRGELLRTKVPVLVLAGDHDVCFPVEDWFALVRQLPTTQIIVMPKTGHGPQHEYPKLSARYIKNFVKYTK